MGPGGWVCEASMSGCVVDDITRLVAVVVAAIVEVVASPARRKFIQNTMVRIDSVCLSFGEWSGLIDSAPMLT